MIRLAPNIYALHNTGINVFTFVSVTTLTNQRCMIRSVTTLTN